MADHEAALERLTPTSLRRRASDALRAAIVDGRLRPGERLTETELAGQLGTSRAPVREALRQLEHEGLVVTLPYRGTEVLGVSQEEIAEVLVPIRLTIESFAFRKALPQLGENDIETLRALVEEMRAAGAENDIDAIAEADVRFHELVIERSGQLHCLQIWRLIEPRVRAYFRRDAPEHTRPSEVADEHEELLNALAARDERLVLETLERHIRHYLSPSPRTSGPSTTS
jgi:DNA-binding GntR family transcriptional regulator